MVKWTGKLVVLAMAASLWASPLVACMLPDAVLTFEERECCQNMADDCGQMDMPASHSCCTLTVRETDSYLVNSRFAAAISAQQAPAILDLASKIALPETLHPGWTSASTHSPPVSPPQTISILRI